MKTVLNLFFGGIVYYLTAICGIEIFSFQPSNITVLWLPFAIGTILVHKFGIKILPFLFIGSISANFNGMDNGYLFSSLSHTFIAAFADTFAAYLSALLLKRYVDDKFDSIKGLIPFTLYGAIIPTFISSTIISINLWLGEYIPSQKVFTYIFLLIFADSFGLFLIYPIYKYFSKIPPSTRELKEIIFSSIIIFTLVSLSFTFHFLIFIFAVFSIIMTFRIREDIVSTIILIAIIELIALSATNLTIFDSDNPNDSLLMLMSFSMSLVFMILAIILHQKDLIKHQYLSITDVLTQTKNRFSYKETIEDLIKQYKKKKTPFSMLLFDIDNFKSINDTYGHLIGDKVLAELSSLIQNNIRQNDALFRIGGEEFVVLFPKTTLQQTLDIAQKLKEIIEKDLNTINDRTITVSMGLTEIEEKDTEDTIYRRVDTMLYKSKQNGKNMITFDTFNS